MCVLWKQTCGRVSPAFRNRARAIQTCVLILLVSLCGKVGMIAHQVQQLTIVVVSTCPRLHRPPRITNLSSISISRSHTLVYKTFSAAPARTLLRSIKLAHLAPLVNRCCARPCRLLQVAAAASNSRGPASRSCGRAQPSNHLNRSTSSTSHSHNLPPPPTQPTQPFKQLPQLHHHPLCTLA